MHISLLDTTSEKPLLASRCLWRMRASAEPSPKMAPAIRIQSVSVKRGPGKLGMHSCSAIGNEGRESLPSITPEAPTDGFGLNM